MSAGRSRRGLSDEERVLWKGVTRSIKPLRKRTAADHDPAPPPSTAPGKPPKPKPSTAAAPVALPKPAGPPPLAPLGRRARQRLARGTDAIDARLDLHGRTQAEAHDALLGFLRQGQRRGDRTVLVITGKGGASDGQRGVLKRQVPMWLRLPEFRAFIVGFEPAGIRHGGEGALYLRLRKARE
jgi:DNA-nicking Smr family endonuclease